MKSGNDNSPPIVGAKHQNKPLILGTCEGGQSDASLCGGSAGLPLSQVPSLLRNMAGEVSLESRIAFAALWPYHSPASRAHLAGLNPIRCQTCNHVERCTCPHGNSAKTREGWAA